MTTDRKDHESDEAPITGQGVHRLIDMDTREVSLVDLAANKKRFLLVKRDGEKNDMGSTTKPAETTTTPAPAPAPVTTTAKADAPAPVKKYRAAGSIQDAVERIATLKLAIETSPVSEGAALPSAYGMEIRSLQFFLKSLTAKGAGAGGRMMYSSPYYSENEITKASLLPIAAEIKKGTLALLGEVSTRLEKLHTDLEQVSIFDNTQTKAIENSSDLLGKILVDHPSITAKASPRVVIVAGSVSDAMRPGVLKAIEKAMGDLGEVYVALQTDVAKADGIAGPADLAAIFDLAGQDLDAALASALSAPADLSKAINLLDGLRADVNKGAKAGEAMTTSFNLVRKTLDAAAAVLGVKNEEASVSTTTEKKTTDTGTMVETSKVGKPMQNDRLNRFKSAVVLLKEALLDLKSGAVSLEKFKKASAALASIIGELDVMKGVNASKGIADVRGTTPSAANMGSGVQPDTTLVTDAASGVFGEGVPPGMADVMKSIGDLKAQTAEVAKNNADLKKTNETLRAEVATLRKMRVAPATVPVDPVGSSVRGGGAATEADDYWPMDMASR